MKSIRRVALTGLLTGSLVFSALGQAQDAPPPPLSATSVASLSDLAVIVEGATGNKVKSTVYVFMDPNCIYCHYTWQALQPYEAVGLQVRWIPLGFLKPDSAGKAAALLESQDGAALLRQDEMKFSEQAEEGGITPLSSPSFSTKTKLTRNIQLFQSMGFNGTPTIVYKTQDGKWVGAAGMPSLSSLPAMLNLPEQKQDPSLEKFR